MTPRPTLDQVTLCAVDCVTPELALRALRLSQNKCTFARTLLLTSHPMSAPDIEVIQIPEADTIEKYSFFIQKNLIKVLETPFALVIQWDGYVINAEMWDPGFLEYDYIGAPWWWEPEGQQIGNGGFSLRSRRLMELLAGSDWPAMHPEDTAIGREWRPRLERLGIRFPDVATARRFSVEGTPAISLEPSFGFHNLYNIWRAVPAQELPAFLAAIPPASMHPVKGVELVSRYVQLQRWAEAEVVCRRLERQFGPEWLPERLAKAMGHLDGHVLREAIRALGAGGA